MSTLPTRNYIPFLYPLVPVRGLIIYTTQPMEEVFSGIKHAFDYVFRTRAQRGLLNETDCYWAEDKTEMVEFYISSFEDTVKSEYRHRVDVLNIIEKVWQSLRDEYGGILPHEFISTYYARKRAWQPLTPREMETFERFLDKWLDDPALEKEFSFLRLDFTDSIDRLSLFITEKQVSRTAEGMKKWLLARHGTLEF